MFIFVSYLGYCLLGLYLPTKIKNPSGKNTVTYYRRLNFVTDNSQHKTTERKKHGKNYRRATIEIENTRDKKKERDKRVEQEDKGSRRGKFVD